MDLLRIVSTRMAQIAHEVVDAMGSTRPTCSR
jgi:hypothetical protein